MGYRQRLIDEQLTRREDNSIEEDLRLSLEDQARPASKTRLIDTLPDELFQPSEERQYDSGHTPERIPIKAPPRQAFRQQVGEQIQQAQQSFEEGAREVGAFSEGLAERQAEAGVRVGGVVVAQKEFREALDAEKEAVELLVQASGITDRARLNAFRREQAHKLATARKMILAKANQTRLLLERQKMDAAKKRQTYQLIGTIAGAAIGAYIGNPAAGAALGGAAAGQAAGGTEYERGRTEADFEAGREDTSAQDTSARMNVEETA